MYEFSGVAENTVVDENSVVGKSSEKTVDEKSVVAHFSGVDHYTWSRINSLKSYKGDILQEPKILAKTIEAFFLKQTYVI